MKKVAVFLDTGLTQIAGGTHQSRIGREEIGALLVAACVERDAGWEVRYIRPNTQDVDQIEREIGNGRCDALVLFPYTCTKWLADAVAKRFKRQVPIIYGGYHAGIGTMSELTRAEGLADFVIAGRGDEALPRLLQDLADGTAENAVYRNKSRAQTSSDDPYPLDALPWPKRDETLMQDLRVEPLPFLPPQNLVRDPKHCIIVAGSLGCDGRCNFCTSWMISPRSLHRSPKAVVDEMVWLNETYGSGGAVFHIINPLFNADRNWVMSLCDEMARRGPFPTVCMPDFRLDEEMVRAMKQAGIYLCMMGLEFADSKTRNRRGKRVGDPETAYGLCDEAGIITRAFFMLGRLGMTEYDLEAEILALERLPFRADQLRINFETPFPGSVTAKHCRPGDIILAEQLMTTEHPAFRTDLSEAEWQEARERIVRDYHRSERQRQHYERKIRNHPELEFPIRDFLSRLE
ncbi:MAG: radical SAM protein [Candidatus Moranbacteria bacterium]|nr:radical SAM protein [Candidatus Moranbacteria bacterium]